MKKKSTKSKIGAESEDVVALILFDHKRIKELLLVLKDPDIEIATKRPAFSEFEQKLVCHAKAEEESLYVHLKQEEELRMEGIEGDTEHAIADQLMKEVNESKGNHDMWMAKVKVLAELVDHHVKEEEKEVLKEVQREFNLDKRVQIGKMYTSLRNKYDSEKYEAKTDSGRINLGANYV